MKKVDFYFDLSSPYSYLAATQIQAIADRTNAEVAWKPMVLFVFGLDTASGRPNQLVSLASRPVWGPRWMSSDTGEGDPSVDLEITPG